MAEKKSVSFKEELSVSGIKQAYIVDDVFETPVVATVELGLPEFWALFTDDRTKYPELSGIFGDTASTSDVEDHHIAACWDLCKAKKLEMQDILGKLFGDFPKRLEDLEKLASLLTGMLEQEAVCLKPDDEIPGNAKLIFLDYLLGEDNEKAKAIATKLAKRSPRPYLVLISDSGNLTDKSRRFREDTDYLAGTFAHLDKERAVDPSDLEYSMVSWGLGHTALRVIQPLFDAMILSVDDAADAVKKAMRALSVQDYSLLQNLSLAGDGNPLGEYIVDMFGASLSYRFRDNLLLRPARLEADKAAFNKHLPLASIPSHQIAEIYREALTEPAIDSTISPHPWDSTKTLSIVEPEVPPTGDAESSEPSAQQQALALEPQAEDENSKVIENQPGSEPQGKKSLAGQPPSGDEGSPDRVAWLSTGDIFAKDANSPLLMVLNAGCDLAFAPGTSRGADLERSIVLIEGELNLVTSPQPEAQIARTEFFKFENQLYRITWTDRVRSITWGKFKSDMESAGYTRRIARLSLPYALQVQQAWIANLGRVGVPVAPPYSGSIDVGIYFCEEKKAILRETIKCGATIARLKKTSNYACHYLIAKDTVDAVRKLLKAFHAEVTDGKDQKKARKAPLVEKCLQNMALWRNLQEAVRDVKDMLVAESGVLKICCRDSVADADFNDAVVILHLQMKPPQIAAN